MFYSSAYDDKGSVLTLVNPPKAHRELVITKPSTLNNVLLLNGSPRYRISTSDPAAAKTDIFDARTKEQLVKIKRRIFFTDEITFINHGGDTKKIGKEWLKESKMPDGRLRWDFESSSGDFAWRMDVIHRLVLCPASDMSNPIAWVQLPDETKSFALVVPPASESMWDIIVGGWVILEQRIRLQEKETERAAGMSTAEAAFATSMHMNVNYGGSGF
ncbi:hypothetical protein BJ165DRAFT_1463418 [Panaeolus papilionaceus]|nr:hypothetical protein BJ165DRAFT_1463418 [Panaeolus papilionaceus]